jgi:hypothetical protein
MLRHKAMQLSSFLMPFQISAVLDPTEINCALFQVARVSVLIVSI